MKKLCLVIITVLAFASLAVAQSVSTAELKSVLIDSIKDYLSSQTPKLEKAELKDLIVVYLSTKGDAADLSGNGPFSGKKFIDVYNKAKGITSPTPSPTEEWVPAESTPSFAHGNTISLNAGEERTYLAKVDTDDITSWRVFLQAMANEAYVEYSFTLPDGQVFGPGSIMGTSIGGSFELKSQKYPWGYPNIPDQYMPKGNYVLKLKANTNSLLKNLAASNVDFYLAKKAQNCAALGGSCKPNACNTYTNCALLSTGTCTSGLNCCSGNCIPQGAEILPWSLSGLGKIVQTSPGQKKTYILTVPAGTSYAGAHFLAYDLESTFDVVFTVVPNYQWKGKTQFKGRIMYGGEFWLELIPGDFMPYTNEIPPGNYIVEITWVGGGRILINTGRW